MEYFSAVDDELFESVALPLRVIPPGALGVLEYFYSKLDSPAELVLPFLPEFNRALFS